MRYWKITLVSLVALLVGAVVADPAQAQGPYASFNRERAYQHFLNSPARVRTFSSMQSGQVWGYDTPLVSSWNWVTPGYYHEMISPYGRQAYAIPQQAGNTTTVRPLVVLPPPVVVPAAPYPLPFPH
jgi:hypothetical protein